MTHWQALAICIRYAPERLLDARVWCHRVSNDLMTSTTELEKNRQPTCETTDFDRSLIKKFYTEQRRYSSEIRIRKMRLKWTGHILYMYDHRVAKQIFEWEASG